MASLSVLDDRAIDPTLDLEAEIARLRKERNAVILAHYYQDGEIQDLADFLGDSLQLSRAAAETDADVIVFCGVHFMAETAKILNPDKIVVLPDLDAGCSLSDSCPAPALARFKELHPDHKVVSYINCSAGVKALSDVICTSSNAKAIVESFPEGTPILFAPDRNLGAFLQKTTGREMLLWQGTCVVHETFSERKLLRLKEEHPEAPGHRPPRVRGGHPAPRRSREIDLVPPEVRAGAGAQRLHRGDGGRHPPPDAEGSAQRHLPSPAPRGRLRLQQLPVHEAQHDGEAVPLPARSGAPDRAGRGPSTGGPGPHRADARAVMNPAGIPPGGLHRAGPRGAI